MGLVRGQAKDAAGLREWSGGSGPTGLRPALLILAVTALVLGAPATGEAGVPANGEFSFPSGIATNAAGNVFVVDSGNYRIQKFTGDGAFVSQWGSEGSGKGQFLRTPEGIAVNPAGDVFVTELTDQQKALVGNRIQKFSAAGAFIARWGGGGTGNGQLRDPSRIASDAAGNLYVADSGNSRVQEFSADGAFIAGWGSNGLGDGQFDWPTGIAVGSGGDVYVANSNVVAFVDGDYRIQRFTANGTFVSGWGSAGHGLGQFEAPSDLAIDFAGDVYVVDSGNNRVQKFTADGGYITSWGREGSGNGQFKFPSGIATDSAGDVYVTDSGNDRVQKFTADGAFLAKWGRKSSSRPVRPGRKPLVLPVSARRATFRTTCPHDRRCTAQVTIEAGGTVLARGHYSVAAHETNWVHIALTHAGHMALLRNQRLRAKLRIIDTRTHKGKVLPVILRRQ